MNGRASERVRVRATHKDYPLLLPLSLPTAATTSTTIATTTNRQGSPQWARGGYVALSTGQPAKPKVDTVSFVPSWANERPAGASSRLPILFNVRRPAYTV